MLTNFFPKKVLRYFYCIWDNTYPLKIIKKVINLLISTIDLQIAMGINYHRIHINAQKFTLTHKKIYINAQKNEKFSIKDNMKYLLFIRRSPRLIHPMRNYNINVICNMNFHTFLFSDNAFFLASFLTVNQFFIPWVRKEKFSFAICKKILLLLSSKMLSNGWF